jgi:ankyrin repeat protein
MEANDPINDRSLLYEAARSGQAEVAKVLIARGADVDRGEFEGWTPLFIAAFRGHEEVAIVLLRAGADIGWKSDCNLWTILRAACYSGHLGVTRLLLRHMRGEGLNDRASCGCTALWWASALGRAEVCRAFLLAGADHTIADDRGLTPRQAVQREDDNPCTAVLEVGALTTSQTP